MQENQLKIQDWHATHFLEQLMKKVRPNMKNPGNLTTIHLVDFCFFLNAVKPYGVLLELSYFNIHCRIVILKHIPMTLKIPYSIVDEEI